MNSWIFGFTLALILAIFNLANANDEENMKSWENFKIKNRKMYKLRKDENKRMRNYLKKQAEIDEHNKLYENGIVSYKQDHNKFSDLVTKFRLKFKFKKVQIVIFLFPFFIEPRREKTLFWGKNSRSDSKFSSKKRLFIPTILL